MSEDQYEAFLRDVLFVVSDRRQCSPMMAASAMGVDNSRVQAALVELERRSLVVRGEGVIPRYDPADLTTPALKKFFSAENSGTFAQVREQLQKQYGVQASKTGLNKALQALVDSGFVAESQGVFAKKPQLDRKLAERLHAELQEYFQSTTQRVGLPGVLAFLQNQAFYEGECPPGMLFAVRTVLNQLAQDKFLVVQKHPRSGEKLYQRYMTPEELESHRANQVDEHKQFVLEYIRDNPLMIVTRHRLHDSCQNSHFLRIALDELLKSQEVVEDPEDGARHTMPDGYRQFQSRLLLNEAE
jgi:hypothetical protein